MFLNDFVSVAEKGVARLRTRAGEIIAGRSFEEASVVETHNWVSIVCRERGKLVKKNCREGHNVWTNTGREYLAMLMSIKGMTPSLSYYRSDRIAYLGVGEGSQVEVPSVTRLIAPVEFNTGKFLTTLDLPDFPLYPTRTTVRFHKTFLENDITIPGVQRRNISEMGLFTNGNPSSSPAFQSPVDGDAGRSDSFLYADQQAPAAYKTFEPIGKTNAMQLEVSWEIRF